MPGLDRPPIASSGGDAAKGRVIGLDVYRSIAILTVLACHFSVIAFEPTPLLDHVAGIFSIYGVELFFVLSGFLIGGILIREIEVHGPGLATARRFWVRRWYRTLPNYYFYLVLVFVFSRPWRQPFETLWTQGIWAYPFFLQNFAWSMKSFFIISWSLAIEEWFYLSFPLALAALGGFVANNRSLIWMGTAIFLAVPFLMRLGFTSDLYSNEGVRQVVIYRLDAIALGVLLAYIKRQKPAAWKALSTNTALVSGIAAVALVCIFMVATGRTHSGLYDGYQNACFFEAVDLSCALLLPWFAGLTAMRPLPRLLFTWISVLSYSLYLCHLLAITIVQTVSAKLGLIELPRFPMLTLSLAGTALLALGSYQLIEKPFLRVRERRAPEFQIAAFAGHGS
jgi:peptidoglycan/LPS O-acetylase OafA/YrhL